MLARQGVVSYWIRRFFLVSTVFGFSACTHPAVVIHSYKTPSDTFQTWKQAVERLDLEGIVACYATSAQPSFRKEVASTSSEALRSMQRETKETEFTIEKIVYENNRAYLRVQREREGAKEIEVLTMVKEGLDWKFLP